MHENNSWLNSDTGDERKCDWLERDTKGPLLFVMLSADYIVLLFLIPFECPKYNIFKWSFSFQNHCFPSGLDNFILEVKN